MYCFTCGMCVYYYYMPSWHHGVNESDKINILLVVKNNKNTKNTSTTHPEEKEEGRRLLSKSFFQILLYSYQRV